MRILSIGADHGRGSAARKEPQPERRRDRHGDDEHLPVRYLPAHSQGDPPGRAGGRDMSDTDSSVLTRRAFVVTSTIAGTGFLLGVRIPERRRNDTAESLGSAPTAAFAPNAWIRLDETGDVTILSHKSEMGQGVWTALPMIVAEELDADWDRVRIERAPTIADFDSATGGSSSVSDSWDTLRKAGAVARAMLVAAAAQQWRVPADSCTTERGVVVHAASGRRAPYGSLASTAAKLPVPNASTVSLKDPHTFRIVGTEMSRRDLTAKVTGTAQFGIDVTLPNMLVACIARCPSFRGKVSRVD